MRSQSFVELTRPVADGLVDNPDLVARLFPLAAEIESEDEQVEALVALGEAGPRPEYLLGIDAEGIGGYARRQFLTAWRQVLLNRHESPLATLRATLACFPEEPGAGFSGVSSLAAALLQRGETAAYDAVARSCPSVGLPLLA